MKRFGLVCLLAGLLMASNTFAEGKSRYYGQHLCAYANFTCVAVKRGDTWKKLFPDDKQREIVKRLNRTNMALRYRSWIVVPAKLAEVNHLDMSPFPHKIESKGERVVVVNLKLQAFGAFDKTGRLVHWGPVSGGKGWCPDVRKACNTATGSYKVIDKRGASCESNKFPVETAGGAPMPYCMFYYRGFALHGSELPGYHASHGCIRLFRDDAKWLNKHFTQIGTAVVVVKE